MDDVHFYQLLRYFTTPIQISEKEKIILVGKIVPIEDFNTFSIKKASGFIGECNQRLEKYREEPQFIYRELENIQKKFYQIFEYEFKQPHNPSQSPNLENFNFEEKMADHYLMAFEIKLNAYNMTFSYLSRVLEKGQNMSKPLQKKSLRTKMKGHEFKLALNSAQFQRFRELLIKNDLIDDSVTPKNFTDTFSGRSVQNKIKWKGGNYRLYLFIREINSKGCFGKKLYDGIWEIVADIFEKEDGTYFDPEKLAHSSPAKGQDYKSVKYIAEEIEDLLNLGLED